MDLLVLKDKIFREVHRLCLKPRGFSLHGLRSESHSPPVHRGLVLHSQPWNTQSHVDFDLLITVAHDEYCPNTLHGCRPGLGLRDDALLSWSLCRMSDQGKAFWSLDVAHEIEAVEAEVRRAVENYAVPSLEKASNLEGVLDLIAECGGVRAFKAHSWVLDRLGNRQAAIEVVKAAADEATDAKARARAVDWLTRFGEGRRNDG